jgi:anti-anti-sigma factor
MITGLEISQQEVVEVPKCMVVKFKGYIDTYNTMEYYNQINKIIDDGFINLIFDFSQLSYVSSAWDFGITVLKRVKPLGGNFVYVNMRQRIKEVLDLLGVSRFFYYKATLEEAVSFFKAEDKTQSSTRK